MDKVKTQALKQYQGGGSWQSWKSRWFDFNLYVGRISRTESIPLMLETAKYFIAYHESSQAIEFSIVIVHYFNFSSWRAFLGEGKI